MSECIEWQGSTFHNGYGQRQVKCEDGKWRPRKAHRLAWIDRFGPIPDGLDVMHLCDNRRCYNVDHLVLGTRKANMLDCDNKERMTKARGEDAGPAKLKAGNVRNIRELYAEGKRKSEIAEMYGVTHACIHSIIIGRTWKHLT